MMGRSGWVALVCVGAACTVGPSSDGFSSGPPPGGVVSADGTAGTSAGETESTTGAESGSATGGVESGGLDTTGGAEGPGQTTSSCEGAPGALALGSPCVDGCDCATGECFSVALGAACSECTSDAQCMNGGAGTCSIDPSVDPIYARCTSGEQGVMCQPGSGGCQAGLVCAQIIDTMGFIPDYFCSQCATSADCPGGQTCAPVVELQGVLGGGYLQCVAPGSLPDGGLCPLLPGGEGDGSVCVSGRCAVTDVGGLGIAELGVCSPCADDTDCAGGQTCQSAVIDEMGATPAVCG